MEDEAGIYEWSMPFVFGFIHRFFEFPRSRSRGKFETNVALEILRVYDRRSLRSLVVHAHSASATQPFFFLFFFDLRSVNLEPRFKFQRALRPKEEDRRGLDKLSRRGAATNGSSSFGSVFGSTGWEVIVTILSLCSFQYTQ